MQGMCVLILIGTASRYQNLQNGKSLLNTHLKHSIIWETPSFDKEPDSKLQGQYAAPQRPFQGAIPQLIRSTVYAQRRK